MAHHAAGRHRAPGRFNPLSELTGIVAQFAQPAVKTSAVLAASGGLVAAFAIPATAAPAEKPEAAPAASAPVAAVKAPCNARVPDGVRRDRLHGHGQAEAQAAPRPLPPRPSLPPSASSRLPAAPSSARRSPPRSPLPGHPRDRRPVRGHHVPYGGTSPETGFDLLGYTQYVFRQVGINLPRTAWRSSGSSSPRCPTSQPGDLVFFGSAYHMGIYAGNGMMWDSPCSGKAVALRDIWSGRRHLRASPTRTAAHLRRPPTHCGRGPLPFPEPPAGPRLFVPGQPRQSV